MPFTLFTLLIVLLVFVAAIESVTLSGLIAGNFSLPISSTLPEGRLTVLQAIPWLIVVVITLLAAYIIYRMLTARARA